jgi:hypothetical protein
MALFSYVVARDYGFAPNPFGKYCTLATCKPDIRAQANVGDWIVGIASKEDSVVPRIVYVMRVDEVHTYNTYWEDVRFQYKKPSRIGAVKHLFGDNIYYQDNLGNWLQVDSHHSLDDGTPNVLNIVNDTRSQGVLVSQHFAYWGSNAIEIPEEFLNYNGETLMIKRGYRRHFSADFVTHFISWFESLNLAGFQGTPFRWQKRTAQWSRPRK